MSSNRINDFPQFLVCPIQIIINNNIIEAIFLGDLAAGVFEAFLERLLGLRLAAAQPALQFFYGRRGNEDNEAFGIGELEIQGSTRVEVEDSVQPPVAAFEDRRLGRPVKRPMDLLPFKKIASLHHLPEPLFVDEEI